MKLALFYEALLIHLLALVSLSCCEAGLILLGRQQPVSPASLSLKTEIFNLSSYLGPLGTICQSWKSGPITYLKPLGIYAYLFLLHFLLLHFQCLGLQLSLLFSSFFPLPSLSSSSPIYPAIPGDICLCRSSNAGGIGGEL